jgi:hypothetical protein
MKQKVAAAGTESEDVEDDENTEKILCSTSSTQPAQVPSTPKPRGQKQVMEAGGFFDRSREAWPSNDDFVTETLGRTEAER